MSHLMITALGFLCVMFGMTCGGAVVYVHISRYFLSNGIDQDLLPLPLWRIVMQGYTAWYLLVGAGILGSYFLYIADADKAYIVIYLIAIGWGVFMLVDWWTLLGRAEELRNHALELTHSESFTGRLTAIEWANIPLSCRYRCVLTNQSGARMVFYPTSNWRFSQYWGARITQENLTKADIGRLFKICYYRGSYNPEIARDGLVWLPVPTAREAVPSQLTPAEATG